MHAAFVQLSPRWPDPAREPSQSWQRRFVKPSLGGKAFKTEPPVVFFPLDPKKRHLQWATWSIFGSSETGGLSEDPKKRHLPERQNRRSFGFAVSPALLALACCVQDAGKIGSGRTCGQYETYQKFPPCLAFQVDSLACWMRHPNPFTSLLSLMLLFRIRATSHEQPLNDLP